MRVVPLLSRKCRAGAFVIAASVCCGARGRGEEAGQGREAAGGRPRVPLFEDTRFLRGFQLAFPSPRRGREVEKTLPGVDTSAAPVWRLCQWSTRLSLAGALPRTLESGAIEYSDATKRVVFGGGKRAAEKEGEAPPGSTAPDLLLELRGGQEYEGRSRKAGESWPHLLVEQDAAKVITLDRLERLEVDVTLRLCSFENHMGDRADPGLHAAQLQLFLIVKDVGGAAGKAEQKPGEFVWFGIPFFDSRHPFPPPHHAKDAGKDDASGKLIYSLDGREVLPAPLAVGEPVAIHKDVLPAICEALKYGVEQGYLVTGAPGRYAVVNMNLGWEMPGAHDAGVEIRGLGVTAILRDHP